MVAEHEECLKELALVIAAEAAAAMGDPDAAALAVQVREERMGCRFPW